MEITVSQSDCAGPNDSPDKMMAAIRGARPAAKEVLIVVRRLPSPSSGLPPGS